MITLFFVDMFRAASYIKRFSCWCSASICSVLSGTFPTSNCAEW